MLNKKFTSDKCNINCNHTFYRRVVINTEIVFSDDENSTLSKGLNFNLPYLNKNKKQMLIKEIINTEATIKSTTNSIIQTETSALVNRKIQNIVSNHEIMYKNLLSKYSGIISNIKSIKQKLNDNDAFITKADKGNTLVILNNSEYINKVKKNKLSFKILFFVSKTSYMIRNDHY